VDNKVIKCRSRNVYKDLGILVGICISGDGQWSFGSIKGSPHFLCSSIEGKYTMIPHNCNYRLIFWLDRFSGTMWNICTIKY